jgi:predicted regulator of Ras-like GTPase activity (Roadblock/LC7/MglB family)
MTVDPAVREELGRLRTRLAELSASVLASADGMVMAHDARGIDPESLATLAAAHLAMARRFADAVNHGELRESVVESDRGYITSYTAGPDALLALVSSGDANLAMVHLEARRCVRQLMALLTAEKPPAPDDAPAQPDPATPLARRTPMATLPNSVRRRRAAG